MKITNLIDTSLMYKSIILALFLLSSFFFFASEASAQLTSGKTISGGSGAVTLSTYPSYSWSDPAGGAANCNTLCSSGSYPACAFNYDASMFVPPVGVPVSGSWTVSASCVGYTSGTIENFSNSTTCGGGACPVGGGGGYLMRVIESWAKASPVPPPPPPPPPPVVTCPATTINNCNLPNTSAGGSAVGSCVGGTSGSCNYSCNSSGTWVPNSNSCVVPPPPPPPLPAVPTGLSASAGACVGATGQININWNTVPQAIAYDVLFSGGPGAIRINSGTNYNHSGLVSGSSHYYQVRAVGISGNSNWSAPTSWVVVPNCVVVPPPPPPPPPPVVTCPATTINNCSLPSISAGGSTGGSCVGGTSGICNYSCNSSGTWVPNSNSCVVPPPPVPGAPVVNFSASPVNITVGQSSTLTWTVSGATSCTASGGWSGGKSATGGSENVSPVITTTYNISCQNSVGVATNRSVTVNVSPVVVPPPPPPVGGACGPLTPQQEVSGGSGLVSGPQGIFPINDPIVGPGNVTVSQCQTWCDSTGLALCDYNYSYINVVPPPSAPFGGTVSGGTICRAYTNGSVVNRPDIAINVSGIPLGVGGTITSIRNWATTCVVPPPVPGGQPNLIGGAIIGNGAFTEGQPVTFNSSVTNNGGVPTPVPFKTEYTYSWDNSSWSPLNENDIAILPNGGNSPDASASLTLNPPPSVTAPYTLYLKHCVDSTNIIPESDDTDTDNCLVQTYPVATAPTTPGVVLDGTPTTIIQGGTTDLTWTATDAVSCSAVGGWSSNTNTTGSQTVSPAVTTTYTLTCTGAGGSSSGNVTISVNPPTGTLSPVGCSVAVGQSTCNGGLTWSGVNAVNPYISNQTSPSTPVYSGLTMPAGSQSGISLSLGTITMLLRNGNHTTINSTTLTANCAPGAFPLGGVCQNPPRINLIIDKDLVRSGDTANVQIEVEAPYAVRCTITGVADTSAISHDGTPATQTYTRVTKPLNAKQEVTVSCEPDPSVPGVDPVTDRDSVNVIPSIEET